MLQEEPFKSITIQRIDNKMIDLPILSSWGEDAWRDKAVCRGKDTSLFFPTKEELGPDLTQAQKNVIKRNRDLTSPDRQSNQLSTARLMCVRCPVRTDCLTFAVRNGIVHGMYGGKPPRERRGMRLDNLDARLSFPLILKDLHRARRLSGKAKKIPLAQDLASLLNISRAAADRMVKHNDYPEFI
jgi:WhiB family redox-sensing transcriptional regulator